MIDSTKNNENRTNINDMQDFENNFIAFYNQQIIQILCSDTIELEIELERDLVSLLDYLILLLLLSSIFSVNHHLIYLLH